MVFLDRALGGPDEKLGSAASSDKPAYSDGIHRHIGYNFGCSITILLRVVPAQKLGGQAKKFIGCLEICQVPGADLPARCAGNSRGQFGCLRDDLIVGTVDDERGAGNAAGLSAYIDRQIELDLTCNPLPIGERHVAFDHVFVMEKDSKRFPESGGWGYALFNYEAASDTFTADPSPSDCGHACHVAVKAKDHIFHPYQKR
jgi:Cytochrome P460